MSIQTLKRMFLAINFVSQLIRPKLIHNRIYIIHKETSAGQGKRSILVIPCKKTPALSSQPQSISWAVEMEGREHFMVRVFVSRSDPVGEETISGVVKVRR